MMKRLIVFGMLLGTVAAPHAAQMPKYGVSVTAEKNVDYSKFKTYSWTPGQPSAVKEIDAQIIAAVDRELGAIGMQKAASGKGDVQATYYSLTRTDVDLKGKADAQGVKPQYSVGTLVVALLDPISGRRLLRLRADKPIDTDLARIGPEIDAVVAELFTKYPTRTRK
jgi:hypothetical protein